MKRILAMPALLLGMAIGGAAVAAEVEVKMLNKGSEGVMVFEPSLVKIAPGDTVKFVPTDKGHNVETIAGMLPGGATAFVGKINEPVSVVLDTPGVYGVKCKPHYGMGMVAIIVVGTPTNADQAKAISHPGRAKQVFTALFEKLGATQSASK
jgi:pseudoazurin